MSCRVRLPEENPEVEAVVWRPASLPATPGAPAAPVDQVAVIRAQAAQLQQQTAQQNIIALVRQLESEGVLSLKGAVGEQYVV